MADEDRKKSRFEDDFDSDFSSRHWQEKFGCIQDDLRKSVAKVGDYVDEPDERRV